MQHPGPLRRRGRGRLPGTGGRADRPLCQRGPSGAFLRGGVVKRPENLRALRQNGVVLFIDRPLDALTVGGGRPLSTSAEALKTMEAQRRPLYLAAADAVIPNETTVADAVAAALEALDAIFVH